LFKQLYGGIANYVPCLLPKTDDSSSQAGGLSAPKNGTVHVHAMWYQPTPLPRVTSRDQHFRGKLIAAYIGMTNGTRDLPPNVKAHLWTDRKSMHALYMPVAKSNGVEIELPHSMLARAPLSVHLDGEIEELIAQVPDKELRTMFEELYNHPAGENIGLRSDVVRLLYGILYSENTEKATDGLEPEINMHVDIDTLAAINSEKAGKQLGQGNVMLLGDLQKAKLELRAMHKSLEGMKLSAKPAPLSKEEVAALADRPQKSWSIPAPMGKSTGAQVVIPDKLHKRGYMMDGIENDVLAMAPGHRKAVMVAKQTHHLLKTGNYKPNLFFDPRVDLKTYKAIQISLQKYAKLFHSLNGGVDMPESKVLDQQHVVDYFRQAEKIRQMKPVLQEKMDALSLIARDETRIAQERDIAKMQIEALRSIYETATELVESFVNKSSYFPQAATSAREMVDDFLELSKLVFGAVPDSAHSDSWKGGRLESAERNKYDGPAYKTQERLVFEEIKAMIRFPTAE
jgi:hypothetical protein